MSLSIPHCIHARDPPLLYHPPLGTYVSECSPLHTWQRSSSPPHPPLGTCVTERPPLRTCQSSSSPPPSPTGNLCQSVSPTVYMAEILLSSPIPHWGHVSLSIPHCVHGGDSPLLPHRPLGTCVTEHPPLHTCQRSSSPPPLGTCVTERHPLHTWQRSSSPPPLGTCVTERHPLHT